MQFPWKTTREKVPYEGRTRQSDRQNRYELMTKTILLLPEFVLSKMSHESEHSESEFYYQGELSDAELSRQLTPKAKKEIYTCNM